MILGISGSPRKSNTEILLSECMKCAEEFGEETKIIRLREFDDFGCCGWSECFYKQKCIKKDRFFNEIYPVLERCKKIVLATPVYFNNVSGIMKHFIDRTNPYALKKRVAGKLCGIICVGGSGKKSLKKCSDILRDFCSVMGWKIKGEVLAEADKENEILKNKNAIKEAKSLGVELAKVRC